MNSPAGWLLGCAMLALSCVPGFAANFPVASAIVGATNAPAVRGTNDIASAERVAIDDIGEQHEGRFISVSGTVRSYRQDTQTSYFELLEGARRLRVSVHGTPPTNYSDLSWIGVPVRIKGLCVRDSRAEARVGYSTMQLVVDAWQFVEGEVRTVDWTDLPVSSASEAPAGFARLQGVVEKVNGPTLLLRTGDGPDMRVIRRSAASPTERRIAASVRQGDRLDVFGFSRRQGPTVEVEDALFRIIGQPLQTNLPPDAPIAKYLPLLVDASSVRDLSEEQAKLNYPVRINGTVTYHDTDTNAMDLFVQDQTAGIYVYLNEPVSTNVLDRTVTVVGTSAPGGFAPIIANARIETRAGVRAVRPARVSLEMIMTGQQDGQLVELSGIVRSVSARDRHLYLDLVNGRERFTALLPEWTDPKPNELVDCRLLVRGVCGTVFNKARQMTGFKVYVPRLENLEIEERPANVQTNRPIRSLLSFNATVGVTHQVRIGGVVIAALPGKKIAVRDSTGCIVVHLAAPGEFRRGDRVDVTGFPRKDSFKPSLEDATAVVRERGLKVDAIPLKAADLVDLDGRAAGPRAERREADLVSVQGILESKFARRGEYQLVLRQAGRLFYAFVPAAAETALSALSDGSELSVEGICHLPREEFGPAMTMRLLLESDAQVKVLRTPSWWNAERIMLLLMAVGCVLLIIAGWAALLRRQVQKRTSELGLINKQLEQQISHSSRVAESLAATEARQRAIIDAEPDCVMILDPQGEIRELNRAGLEMLGAGATTPPETSLLALVTPASRPAVKEFLAGVIAGHTGGIEFEMALAPECHRWVDFRASPLRNADGEVSQVLALVRDVSLRRRNDNELQLKTAVLEHIAEAMTYYLTSRNWREAAGLLLGAAREVTGSSCGFLGTLSGGLVRVLACDGLDWNCSEAAKAAWQQLTDHGFIDLQPAEGFVGDVVARGAVVRVNDIGGRTIGELPPGHPVPRRFLCVPIRVGTELVGVLALANRSEPYTELEQQQVEHLSRIGGLLYDSFRRSEREAALQAQLRQAQKMEAIGQLAAGVAHDFNNLLTIIRGRAELLTLLSASGPAADAGREISSAAERAANLTRQLLTFSRKQPLQLKYVDLNSIIQNLSRMLHRLLREDISIQLHFGGVLPAVYADAGMIEQVVLNLAVNARDAMPSGGALRIETRLVRVTDRHVREQPQARLGDFICLSVADTGVGMSADVMARMFEPFFTTKDVGKGTGLGLATVYGIVQQHNGWVEVSSTIGQGTTFKVYFAAEQRAAPGHPPALVQETALNGDETVLVVEDEPGVRELVRGMLQRFGYRVLTAQSGLDALGVWDSAAGNIDLLMTDMVMPEGISGLDLAQRLLRRKRSLRVIFTSGYSVQMSEVESQLRPGVEFLPKPYEMNKLAQCVRRCLDADVAEPA